MTRPPQNVELLHDFALGLLLRQELLVDGLEGDEFVGQTMNCQVNFAKCTLSHHFADLVVLSVRFWGIPCLEEGKSDFLLNFQQVTAPW